MKKAILTLTLTFAFIQILSAKHHTSTKNYTLAIDSLKKEQIDLVCKMKVKIKNAKTLTLANTTYYFCAESCKKTFIANPKKYIKK